MRNEFNEQLEHLNSDIISMGKLCEQVIAGAVKIVMEGNDNGWKKEVLSADDEIKRKEDEIESICMNLLLRQQPVARDLRMISSSLKMITDMERIGTQATNMMEMADYVAKGSVKQSIHLEDMANEVISMVTKSVDSFVKKDLELAKKIIMRDDIVDDYFVGIKKELISIIADDREKGEEALDIIMISKYLERIGDHATNIAEWVEYSITGRHDVKNR